MAYRSRAAAAANWQSCRDWHADNWTEFALADCNWSTKLCAHK